MAKKSKKTKAGMMTKIMRLIACVAMIPVLIVPFLKMFAWQTATANTASISDSVGIFADWSTVEDVYKIAGGTLNTAIMTIASIMLITLCVVGVVYIVLTILSLLMPKIKLGKLLTILGWGTLILTIVTSVLLIITPLITSYSFTLISKTTYCIVLTGTTYMVLSGILSGIFSILAEKMK